MSEPGRRPVLDGALFGLYEDDEPERRAPVAVLVVLVLVALVVAGLVWRAVRTDADLELPADEAATTTAPDPVAEPTVEGLRLLLPARLDGCEEPEPSPGGDQRRAVLRCDAPGGSTTVELSLYPSVAERDQAFDFVAALVGVPHTPGACALGRPGRHDYVGVEEVGQLACRSGGGRTDLLWTSDRGALLGTATGGGSYAALYDWWADLVQRTDGAFPTGEEQAVLDQLPEPLLDGCRRDPDLRLASGGDLAITCRPERSPAGQVSWIDFELAGRGAMARWLDTRRQELEAVRVDDGPQSCAPDGFGRPDLAAGIDDDPAASGADPTPPRAGSTDYDLGGRSGAVLCHLDDAGRGVVVWTRDASRLGSVAIGADGVPITDLLAWWERGGHLP